MTQDKSSTGLKQKAAILGRVLANAWRLRPGMVIGYFVGAALEISGSLITIYATAQLGNLLAHYITGKPTDRIWFWLAIDVLATVVIGIGFWLMSFCQRLIYFRMVQWSVSNYMRQLCSIDYPDHFDQKIRDQINKIESGFSWVMAEITSITLELVYGIARFLAITVVVAQISWWLIPLIILFLLPSLVSEARLAKLVWFVWDQKGDQRHVFWSLSWIFKQARAQMEIRSLQARDYLVSKIERMNAVFYHSQETKYRQASRRVVVAKIFEAGGVAIGSVILIKRFIAGTISFDRYLFLSGALLRVGGALNAVFGTITRLQEPLLYAENFYDFIDRPIQLIDKPDARQLTGRTPKEIRFENVTFTYPGSVRPSLQNLNLTIKAGEHIALVGENGAGKSTLIKLLMRFYLPDSGRITIDGTDLQDIAIDTWYSHMATLFQEFNRYPFSVKENIALQPSSPDKQRLAQAIELGGLQEMIDMLPKGLNTVLDSSFKDGVDPSGGQYQRVALARAFYRQASLLILDEPTAAIDAKAEYDIFNNIFDYYRTNSVVIVSHRFSTVRRADRIVVLHHGRVIEEGSHASLMKQRGNYHEMFTKQAEGYQ